MNRVDHSITIDEYHAHPAIRVWCNCRLQQRRNDKDLLI